MLILIDVGKSSLDKHFLMICYISDIKSCIIDETKK